MPKFEISENRVYSLREMQAFVGGWIDTHHTEDAIYVMDDDGIAKGLPINEEASKDLDFNLVGNVLKYTGKARETYLGI